MLPKLSLVTQEKPRCGVSPTEYASKFCVWVTKVCASTFIANGRKRVATNMKV
jgi:hypothetical protein